MQIKSALTKKMTFHLFQQQFHPESFATFKRTFSAETFLLIQPDPDVFGVKTPRMTVHNSAAVLSSDVLLVLRRLPVYRAAGE